MSTPKDASNADRLAAAEGQAAVEAIAETEAGAAPETTDRAPAKARKEGGMDAVKREQGAS